MLRLLTVLMAAMLLAGPASWAQDVPFQQLEPQQYQSFVANWSPDTKPFCAVLRSAADWNRVLKPAPTMDRTRPFAPPPEFWRRHAVLLLARVVGGGDASQVFQVIRGDRDKRALRVDYKFRPTPPASSTMKWYLALAVDTRLPRAVLFYEDGHIVCTARARR